MFSKIQGAKLFMVLLLKTYYYSYQDITIMPLTRYYDDGVSQYTDVNLAF